MILYSFDNDPSTGQILNSAGALNNILLWDLNDNSLKPATGTFYIKVNTEVYSKNFVKASLKTYNYPGVYYLKCYYVNATSLFTIRKVTVTDRI